MPPSPARGARGGRAHLLSSPVEARPVRTSSLQRRARARGWPAAPLSAMAHRARETSALTKPGSARFGVRVVVNSVERSGSFRLLGSADLLIHQQRIARVEHRSRLPSRQLSRSKRA